MAKTQMPHIVFYSAASKSMLSLVLRDGEIPKEDYL
jgi:hypothetical protein